MRLRPVTAAVLVFAVSLPAVLGVAGARERIKLQRYLENLLLGDKIDQIEMVYPPKKKKKWKREKERKTKLLRIHLVPGTAKYFPAKGREMILRMRRKRLVWIQVVFNREESRRKPLEELVVDLSLVYGEPRRIDKRVYEAGRDTDELYCWWDGDTALVASNVRVETDRGDTPEVRTSLELMERSYFKPLR